MIDTDDVLIADIETQTFGRPDPEKDRLKLFGCYSYKTNKYYIYDEKEDIIKAIKAHKIIVGFNYENYDKVVLEREGISHEYKIIVDLFDIFKKRAASIKIKAGMLKDLLMSYSLDYITKTLGIVDEESGKGKIDHALFSKEKWSFEEKKMMYEYLRRDIEVTKKLYEWVEEYFDSFKNVVSSEDLRKKKYLTDSISVFTYKFICAELGVLPEFNNVENLENDYEGGYVAYPTGESFHNNLALFDYSSLYPNIFIQCNLFSDKCTCCEENEKWNGGEFFKISGRYCKKKQGRVEEIYKKFFRLRKQYKKEKNPLEYVYKIVLNTGYGLTGNPKFKHLYNRNTASDCTAIGRQIILYTRKRFREESYKNVFTDTDSVCVQFPEGKNLSDAIELSKKIVLEVQQHMPFPW